MEIAVILEPLPASGFRASCRVPVVASAEGTSREDALARLHESITASLPQGAEMVTIRWRPLPTKPIFPDDELTRQWLAAIAEARLNQQSYPWEENP